MEGAACRLLVPLTLLVLVPVAAAIAADEEVGYADVVGNKHKHKHKHRAETAKSTGTGTGTDEDVGYSDVMGNKLHESETQKATNIADFDAVWRKRAEEAQRAAFDAYNPHPEKVTNSLNKKVKGSFENPTLVKQADEIKKEESNVEGKKEEKHEGKKEEKKEEKEGKKEDKHEGKKEGKEEDKHEGKKEEKNEGKKEY